MTDLQELLQVVDRHDKPLRGIPKERVWRQGLIHRVARILIFNAKGEMLVQKRGKKILYPYRWDVSAAGHVREGESYEAAARREANEEIGQPDLKLKEVSYYYAESRFNAPPPTGLIVMNKFVTVYRAELDALPANLGKDEVIKVEWWPVDTIKTFVAEHPDEVTDGLQQVTERYLSKTNS